ncbi:MAG: glycosyltransferase family 9 protein [Elusimicrobia bacterium]|nr:glycosyltransferase family 9 protein [Elusimicrobiota bacterium]
MARIGYGPVRKILIIKLCCLGDLMQMTPAIRALRGKFPEARIDFLCCSWAAELAQRLPGVDRIICWDEPYVCDSKIKVFHSAIELAVRFRREGYDWAVIGHRFAGFGILSWISGIPRRAGFSSGLIPNFWLTHPVPYDESAPERRLYLRLAQALDAHSTGEELEIRVDDADREALERLLDNEGVFWEQPPIAVVAAGGQNPGMSMVIKRWPVDQYVIFLKRLLRETNNQLVFVGSRVDEPVAERIIREVGQPARCWNFCGKTSLTQLAALLSRCRLVIGGDTGPLYLAAACGTPVLMIYGPTNPEFLAPAGRAHRILWNRVYCAPCCTPATIRQKNRFEGKEFVCWTKTHACLRELSVDEVFMNAKEMIETT